MMSLVERRDHEGVCTLTLNRPEKLNALNPPLFAELRQHVDDLTDDSETRCVVLTGAGRAFSAGNDLTARQRGEQHPTADFPSETVELLSRLPMPTIAKITGFCMTGGLELALACEILVATESATFADTHGKWGLVPAWGLSVRLPERVGYARAKEMSYTGRQVHGPEALSIGLVNRCVPDDDLDAAVDEMTTAICANSAGSNRIYKRLYADSASMEPSAALKHERSVPYGLPDDAQQRMEGFGRK
jgi:enoyl-CoA hydratase/carnithine racemase